MSEKVEPVPMETEITKARMKEPKLWEKFESLYKRYERAEEGMKTYRDLALGMKVSERTIKNTIARLKYETTLKEIKEEVKEEAEKKYDVFALRVGDPEDHIYESPIEAVNTWIKRMLRGKRPRTRGGYVMYATMAWKHVVEKYGLFNPVSWTRNEVEDFIFSDRIARLEASSQNRCRSAINSFMKSLGKHDIKFGKLKEVKKPIVYMSEETKRAFFRGCKELYPENGIIPFTVGIIALKTGTRIGTSARKIDRPELDRGMLGIRVNGIDLTRGTITLLDKGGVTWTKYLDDETEKYVREYLKWREEKRPQWKENPYLFGSTSYYGKDGLQDVMEKIRRKYNLFETDAWGKKRWIHWHIFRDNFANECLLALQAPKEGEKEPDFEKGMLACCRLGGWDDPKTFLDRYIARETLQMHACMQTSSITNFLLAIFRLLI